MTSYHAIISWSPDPNKPDNYAETELGYTEWTHELSPGTGVCFDLKSGNTLYGEVIRGPVVRGFLSPMDSAKGNRNLASDKVTIRVEGQSGLVRNLFEEKGIKLQSRTQTKTELEERAHE